jgi:hypothetical protein
MRSRPKVSAEASSLDDLESDIESGAVVVVGDNRTRLHFLPPLHDD